MPEINDTDADNRPGRSPSDSQMDINLEELAEEIVRLLKKEIQIEDDRIGKR